MTALQVGSPLLTIEHLTKRFGRVDAVGDFCLEVRRGEFLTLLGPSGCGKSTTLMCIAGLERPDGGRILLNDRDITNISPELRGMGVVFQNYALFPHMTEVQNIMFPLLMRGWARSKARAKAEEALAMVQLAPRNVFPKQLSGGQMQRVAVARALVFDPAVLLMDEPLAAMDRRLRQAMQYELRRLQSAIGTTVIYVTHDQEEALVLSDRIGVMRDGILEQVGTPVEVYEMPRSTFVANFLGESNRSRVRIEELSADMAIVTPWEREAPRIRVPHAGLRTGEAILFVRPENVRVHTQSHTVPVETEETCLARVIDVVFVGDHVRLEVQVFNAEIWTVKLQPRDPGVTPGAFGAGSSVRLSWDRPCARLLPPSNQETQSKGTSQRPTPTDETRKGQEIRP